MGKKTEEEKNIYNELLKLIFMQCRNSIWFMISDFNNFKCLYMRCIIFGK